MWAAGFVFCLHAAARNSLWIPALPSKWVFLLHAAEPDPQLLTSALSSPLSYGSMKWRLLATSQTPLEAPYLSRAFSWLVPDSLQLSWISRQPLLHAVWELGNLCCKLASGGPRSDCGHHPGELCPLLGLGSMGFSIRPRPGLHQELCPLCQAESLNSPRASLFGVVPTLECDQDGIGAALMR